MITMLGSMDAIPNINATYEDHREEFLRIDVRTGCSMEKVKLICKTRNKFWFDELYDITVFENAWKDYSATKLTNGADIDIESFDGHLWTSVTDCLEKYRLEVYNTLIDINISEVDAHFLSIKFAIDTLKKFRGKFCNAFNANDSLVSYHNTFFRPCFILLIERMDKMTPKKTYLYSKKAANTIGYRREAARLCAKLIEDETLAIVTSKFLA